MMAAVAGVGRGAPAAADAVEGYVAHLSSSELQARWYAVYALGQLGPAARAATGPLLKLLAKADEDEYVCGGAAWALGRIGQHDAKIVDALAAALKSDMLSVRVNAAEALGSFGPAARPAVKGLVRLLDDPDVDARIAVAAALVRIDGQAKGLSALTAILAGNENRGPYEAAVALGQLGPVAAPALPALVTALGHPQPDTARAAAWALGQMGPAAVEPLAAVLKRVAVTAGAAAAIDVTQRRHAIAALEWIGAEGVSALTAGLSDPAPAVRRDAARALGRIGPAAAAARAELLKAVADPDAQVRQEAAGAWKSVNPDQ